MELKKDLDVRDTTPEWYRYLVLIDGTDNHDKFYEARVDLTDESEFCLTYRWGRRPDLGKGQIKTEYFTSMARAMGTADAKIEDKIRNGYQVMSRPTSANNQVVDDFSEPE